ncbi:DNA polymerase domain-containing protein [Nitrososphaera sp. AFS]|uniref:DNA polymerase domain-containing protein n=1 Tax=Nitrososphaera sp. AFS TaxID=2301191 RepID=UPI00139230CB|nr:DNA polymerase domain-containing protein [Nitrososphaera sp. AFS]
MFKFEGGYVRDPVAGIHRNVKTYDFVSMYPSVCIQYKISSETINCSCCKYDKDALIPQQVQDEVDSSSKGSRNWKHYWICKKKESGKLSEIMGKLMKEKDQFKEKGLIFPSKAKKLIMNSGYGAFGYVKFAYFDPRVCELITAYSRYIIKEISKLLVNSDQNSKVIYGDTDSIFVTGGDSIDIIAEAKNRFGVRFELDKVWKILFLFNEKKQYFGMTADGKLETKTLTGLKDDKTKFCNMATSHLIRKDLLEMFIEKPKEALRQAVKYTRSIFHELEDRLRNGDLDFIIIQLSLTELASKALYDYSSDDWHTRAYKEILEDCNGDEELAKKKSQGEKEYTYWKILTSIGSCQN